MPIQRDLNKYERYLTVKTDATSGRGCRVFFNWAPYTFNVVIRTLQFWFIWFLTVAQIGRRCKLFINFLYSVLSRCQFWLEFFMKFTLSFHNWVIIFNIKLYYLNAFKWRVLFHGANFHRLKFHLSHTISLSDSKCQNDRVIQWVTEGFKLHSVSQK